MGTRDALTQIVQRNAQSFDQSPVATGGFVFPVGTGVIGGCYVVYKDQHDAAAKGLE